MVSVGHHAFAMLPRHMSEEQHEHFGSVYPDPPQSTFSTAGIDMGLASDAYFPRLGQEFPTIMTGLDHIPYSHEGPNGWAYGGRMSPPMFQEDREMGIPSNNSPASVPSAPSSAVGSPRSNHGQPAPISEWAGPQGVAMSPNIVSHDYYTGTEYSFAPQGMEDLAPFAFADASKPPGFVGELPQTPKEHLQHQITGPMSPSMSCESPCNVLAEPGPVVDTRSAAAHAQTMRLPSSPESIRKPNVFASSTPTTPFSSPELAWMSPTTPQVVSPFFSQSSGHFVAPLGSSCWFPYLISIASRIRC